MARVLPFRGLRFDPRVVGDLAGVVCPPYDVISPAQQEHLQAQNQFNAVYLELPADRPGVPDSRYTQAAETLSKWRDQGALASDPQPAYYLHETQFRHAGKELTRRDLIAALGVEPWSSGSVLPHERTMTGPKADRMALLHATRANVSPIWVLHRDQPEALARAWEAAESQEPAARFSVDDEDHRMWVLDDPSLVSAIEQAFAQGGPLYIADGHHRYETALAFKDQVRGELPGAQATLAVLSWADDPGLVVLPTHRLLRVLPPGFTAEEMEVRWGSAFHAEYFPVWEQGTPEQVAAFKSHLESQGYNTPNSKVPREAVEGLIRQVEVHGQTAPSFGVLGPQPDIFSILELRGRKPPEGAMPADRSDAWKELDVALLHVLLLDPLLEEIDQPREEVLSYTRDPNEGFVSMLSGSTSMAFFLNSTKIEQVLAVADAEDRMPEKSTYFYPKPPTGLVMRDLMRP